MFCGRLYFTGVICSMSRCIVKTVSQSVISRPTTDCTRLYLSCYKLNKKSFTLFWYIGPY